MWWSVTHGEDMTKTDKKICQSKILDVILTVAAGLLAGKITRRVLFRIELPFFEMAMQNSVFGLRWIKSVLAYSFAGVITYYSSKKILHEEFLVDRAMEYKYNFDKTLSCPTVDRILTPLCHARFGAIA